MRGDRRLPRAEGVESIENLPKCYELSSDIMYRQIIVPKALGLHFPNGLNPDRHKIDRGYILSVLRDRMPGTITGLVDLYRQRVRNRDVQQQGVQVAQDMLNIFQAGRGINIARNNRAAGALGANYGADGRRVAEDSEGVIAII